MNGYCADRLKENRVRSCHTSLECEVCSDLKRHFRRVYIVVGTIDESCLEVYYREGTEDTLLNCILQTLFNSREEVLRNSAAEYILFKYECLGICRLELDPYVTILTVTAGLLLMLTLYLNFLSDRFTIRNTRLLKISIYIELRLQLTLQYGDLLFAETADNHLLRLCVVHYSKYRILILQLVKTSHDLIFFTSCLRDDAHGKTRCREVDLGQCHNTGLVAESIICLCDNKFRNSTDISGNDLICRNLLLTYHVEETAQTLFLLFYCVIYSGVALQNTCINAEQRDTSYERVSDRLKYESCKRIILVTYDRELLTIRCLAFLRRFSGCRRSILGQAVQEELDAPVLISGTTVDRVQNAICKSGMYAAAEFVLCERLAGEILLHQFFVALCDYFVDLVLKFNNTIFKLCRERDLCLCTGLLVESKCTLIHNIDDTCHLITGHDRQ